ncbi:MAG: peptidoglycan-binding protein [Verrucomicrobia bacterium]|nr:peptidoglycan-binding protein [Leptolyngbya sp. ES-bin-22]
MVIPASLLLVTCVGCPPSSPQPAQLPVKAPQPDAAPFLSVPTVPRQLTKASNAAVPDAAIAVEWSARSRESSPATVLKRGSQGVVVVRLQARLARLGYPLAKDGNFGSQTQAAVMQFQQANGLVADGVVEASSWAQLNYEITQLGSVPLSQSSRTTLQPTMPVLPSPTATSTGSIAPTTSIASKPTLAAAVPSASRHSQKNGWIVVLVVIQGIGWLVILQGLNKELVLLTGRSLLPGKNGQWLFSFKQ